ncbi:hypothetical protein [Streptomyces sp. NPDC059575]|uniref:hypothetical protein n=1 Tax=Streptomyces sp. NPDC059575 TaxID=3346872 RepID=UPI0036909D70
MSGGAGRTAGERGGTTMSARVDGEVGDTPAGSDGTGPAEAVVPEAPEVSPRPATRRRGTADPVKALLHQHRDLCERAVDALEIAAGLEAHGVTDRTAARFRHRDVFSLAEELYARVPREDEPQPPAAPGPGPRIRTDWVLLTLLPGALAAAAAAGLLLTHGQARLLTGLGAPLLVGGAVAAALRRGPLATRPGTAVRQPALGTRVSVLCLLAYALLGDGFLGAVISGGPDNAPTLAPDGPWPVALAPALALLLSCAPAAWCAHLLGAAAHRRLAGSRGLEDFTVAARPLLLGALALYLAALAALLAVSAAVLREPSAFPQALALGALLLLARLLTAYHHRHAPAVVLGSAAIAELAAPALVSTGRLPGCGFAAVPVQRLVDAWGPAAVPVLVCGAAAVALLVHALRTLTRASAHAPTGAAE